VKYAVGTGSSVLPFGKITVTPVLTGPFPNSNFPSPLIKVLYPTRTSFTSVMALNFPVVPSKGIPKSLALCCARSGKEINYEIKIKMIFFILNYR
jgi:hypothetical protein